MPVRRPVPREIPPPQGVLNMLLSSLTLDGERSKKWVAKPRPSLPPSSYGQQIPGLEFHLVTMDKRGQDFFFHLVVMDSSYQALNPT